MRRIDRSRSQASINANVARKKALEEAKREAARNDHSRQPSGAERQAALDAFIAKNGVKRP